MWQKCKGQNTNAADDEAASNELGAKFIEDFYVCSTIYGGGSWFSKRTGIRMNNGTFSFIIGSNPTPFYVRCVRDKTN